METEDVVNLILHYRHDVLNQLQVVDGYIKLGNIDKVEANMSELLEYFDQESKLISLNLPNVLLWFLQFRTRYENYNLTYDVDIEGKKIIEADHFIVEKLEQIMGDIQEKCSDDIVSEIEVEFKDNIDYCEIAIYIDLEKNEEERINDSVLEDIDINIAEHERRYSFQVSINNEVK